MQIVERTLNVTMERRDKEEILKKEYILAALDWIVFKKL